MSCFLFTSEQKSCGVCFWFVLGFVCLFFDTVEKQEVQNWRLYVSEVILNLKDGDHKIQILEKSSVQMLF